MDIPASAVTGCQRCHHYTPQGRRGGHCSQLNVPVQGRWQPCPLAIPAFLKAPSESIVTSQPLWSEPWQQEAQQLPIPSRIPAPVRLTTVPENLEGLRDSYGLGDLGELDRSPTWTEIPCG